jgi:hypothetical protein
MAVKRFIPSRVNKQADEMLEQASKGTLGTKVGKDGKEAGIGLGARANIGRKIAAGNIDRAVKAGGFNSAWSMGASHAIRGAAWGGVAGGTVEAAQGGSFWDGAKQGALNGAVGWTGYRMASKAAGATGGAFNFVKNGKDIARNGSAMWGMTSKNAKVSKDAANIVNQKMRSGLTESIMNGRFN